MSAREGFVARNVGRPVERVEDPRFLRGRGEYVDDLHRDGMLHAAILRSAVAHGRLRSIDAGVALSMPGVRAIYTAEDVARSSGGKVPTIPLRLMQTPALAPFEQPAIVREKIRYVGEPLAVVVADDPALAEDAAEAIVVDIDALPAVADRHVAGKGDVLLFEQHGSNRAITYTATKGDVASMTAPYVRRETFGVQRHTAVAMEARGLLAEWDEEAGRLVVSGAAKVPFATRRILAQCMDLPEASIEMMECDVGGGFGVRGEFYPEDFLIPFAARQLGRPVKWIEDRRENLLGSNHAREADIEIEIACERDGRIVGLRATAWVDMGAYVRTSGAIPPRTLAQGLSGPYDIANVHVQSSMMLTNKAPVGTYRAPGRFEGTFFRERMFDIVARELGIDPVTFRLRNFVKPGQMPYRVPDIAHAPHAEHFDSGDYAATFRRCLAEFGWTEKQGLQGRLIDGRYHGLGLASFIEGGAAGPRENVRLEVDGDGYVSVYTGAASVGQGVETACAQIAADALGVSLERIRVFHGSTPYVSAGFGAFHSRCIVVGGSAIVDAAARLKEAVRQAAASDLGCEPSAVTLGESLTASFGGRALSLQELAQRTPGLSADGTFVSTLHTYAYGSAAAHVAVDPRTGHVELIDFTFVEDVGRVINPLMMQGQAIGGIVQGLGGTFLEHLVYDQEGHFLSGTLADYMLPTATDFPNIRAVIIGECPSPNNPLGAKGGGEGGVVPVAGVIGNAVSAALAELGVEIRHLPLSPDRVWTLIRSARPHGVDTTQAPLPQGGEELELRFSRG